jgi:IPT/TIG domain
VNLVELQRVLCQLRIRGPLLGGLLVVTLMAVMAIADGPIASSSFVGAENPLSENGAWVAVMAYSPYGTRFQKNNGAYPDRLSPLNHAGARTTAVVPADHYSEIVVGHVGNSNNNVGAIVRVQTSGATTDSNYLWWASVINGGNYLYRMDANVPDPTRGTTYTATSLIPTSPVVDGDRLRLIARGQVIYGIKNGVRDFIYNTGSNTTKYSTGTTGIFAYADGAVTNAMIASWSTGPAPVSSGTWASSTFAGTENPLDEGDRWYPLPGYYSGFRKAGGLAIGRDAGHNASGVWSITPPATQYSEVTLGTVASGGGGPIVRIDRNNPGQTGWLLFLYTAAPSSSGIYKMTPDGNFTAVRSFTPTIVPGDKWRLTATGNTLEAFKNGVSQFTYTTDGSYPTGDVGIEAYTPAFTFTRWEGGDTAGGTVPPAPTITSFAPTSGTVGTSVTISGTNFTAATAVTFNTVSASFTVTSDTAIQATVPAGATTGPLSVTTPAGTATSTNNFTVVSAPTITSFAPTSGTVGTSVTISGTNFTGATAVTFNTVSASFTVTSDTAIQATVPAGATTGPLRVTTPGGTATSTNNFTVSVIGGAGGPIASSSFVGAENPLSENGAWLGVMAYSPYGTRFQKNNGAYPDRLSPLNHAGARTTAVVPADHYSEIVVGHVGNSNNNVGAIVRVQTSGATTDSNYLWWASVINGGNFLYRLDSNVPDNTRGTTYTATALTASSPVIDGDRLRLIARGQVIYGIKNGVRDFIYNTGTNTTKYSTGTTGIFAYADGAVTNAIVASWSTGAAPVSSGTWASSTFAGTENPLDEGDRWYPLPGYAGFRKAGGQAIGLGSSHNASGVWSIAPPATQYSEVTLGAVTGGGGGPIVRIDRNNPGQTGWLLFLYADSPSSSGIYKMTPDGNFTGVQFFAPTIILGDKWRLTATGNTLEVFRNGVSQFTYTTDGSYPTGDVGIEAYSPAFTFTRWEGGDTAGGTVPTPTITSFAPTSGPVGTSVTISGTNFTAATAVTFNGVSASFVVSSDTAIQATVPAGAATGPLRVTTPGGTATSTNNFTVVSAPTITSFAPTSGPVGTSVTISGTNFTGATAVTFNAVSATSFTVTSDTAIQATVPTGATTGPLRVTTPAGTATSTNVFTVVSPPTISGFTPTSGPVGTSVTISGTNFTGATAVTFNGVSATSFTVTSDTAIQATVPTGATTGPLRVTTPAGTATSTNVFTVVSPPTISGFTPASGPVGTSVTISGTNFTGATAVTFNGVSATSFTVTSDTAIQATVPTGATTGPLRVTTPVGTATSANNFTVTAILTVTKTGLLGGTVTSGDGAINCGDNCSASYVSGTVVTLTATPNLLSLFSGWEGCDAVSGMTCTVNMSAARSVTANFLP